MWVGVHLLAGATVYEVVRRKPLWAKVSLTLAGGFMSHWVLDEVGAYHLLHGPWWYWGILAAANTLAVLAVVRKGRWYLLSGLWAWLCWDFEWILGSQGRWIHLSGIFPRYIRDVDALDSLGIQVGLMVLLSLILLIPCREARRERSTAGTQAALVPDRTKALYGYVHSRVQESSVGSALPGSGGIKLE